MALQEPVAVYAAETDEEADLVRAALARFGVESFVTEDLTTAGFILGGPMPGTHVPKVWVDRADAERAAAFLQAYEHRKAEEDAATAAKPPAEGPPIEALCEDCGERWTFPARQRGTVQECPGCGAYLDVGADDQPGDWGEPEPDESAEEEGEDED